MISFRPLSDLRGWLLESPVWDDRRDVLFLCDSPEGLIHEVGLEEGLRRSWDLGGHIGSLGLCESGSLVVAQAREVLIFDPETGARASLWRMEEDEPPSARLNDGKVGPDGAFWIGGMDGRIPREPIGKLYRIDAGGGAQTMVEGLEISNGLAWSPDGRTMFHSDSWRAWLDRYDFDPETGALSGRRRIRDLDEASGRPDGGATDAEGRYWSAGVSAGLLNLFSRDGDVLGAYPAPAPAPTMPCFCGPDLRRLALTSHRLWHEEDPASGRLYLAEAPVAGAAVARMKGL